MPEKKTLQRAKKDAAEGQAPTTQAGEFVREEIEHVKEGKHGVKNTKQAIAIGLSKARRAGIKLPPPKTGATDKTKKQARRDDAAGAKREGRGAVSHRALSKQAKTAAQKRSASSRSASARKAARTRASGRK